MFEGSVAESEFERVERLVRRGFENPQVYVSRPVVVIGLLAMLSLAVIGSHAWPVVGLLALLAFGAYQSSPRGTQVWNEPAMELRSSRLCSTPRRGY